MKVTEHFDSDEFRCRDGSAYPLDAIGTPTADTWLETRLRPLCEALEVIREAAGGAAINIDSGYRTLAYDTLLYERSAKDGTVATPQGSQHPKGRAADITHAVLSPDELHALIGRLMVDGRLPMVGGFACYSTFVHLDVRPRVNGHVAQWNADRVSNIA